MPRGATKTSAERLTDIELEISKAEESYKAKMAKLKAKRQDILDAEERKANEEITQIMAEKGMTAKQVRELIEKYGP